MRILITGATYSPALNGQSVFMVRLAEGLAAHGNEVCVLFPGSRAVSTRMNGVQLEIVRSLELGPVRPGAYVPYFYAGRVRGVFEDFHPEVLHIHDHYPLSVAAVQEAKRRGLRVVGTNHFVPANVEPYIPGSAHLRPLLDRLLWHWMLRLYGGLDFVTAPSQAAVNMLKAHGLRVPMQAVSCGTDLRRFHPDPSVDRLACRRTYGLDPDRKLFLYVGRIDQEKRIDVLLRAIHLLQRDDIQLGIVGQGSELNRLQLMARDLRLGERVRFIGAVPNEILSRLLNSADVFAMAGEAECLSIASLEAMACALPVVLADAFALPELVTPGVNGFLFRPGDPRDAAHYMGLLADEPALRKQMGWASWERVKPHSTEYTFQTYAALYRQALESAASGVTSPAAKARLSGVKTRLAPESGEADSATVRQPRGIEDDS